MAGPVAAQLGVLSERADALAEAIGAIDPAVIEHRHANTVQGIADLLHRKALVAKDAWREQQQGRGGTGG